MRTMGVVRVMRVMPGVPGHCLAVWQRQQRRLRTLGAADGLHDGCLSPADAEPCVCNLCLRSLRKHGGERHAQGHQDRLLLHSRDPIGTDLWLSRYSEHWIRQTAVVFSTTMRHKDDRTCMLGVSEDQLASAERCSWTKRTTVAPSPTAVAQRLIEPARTSPAA
jgi:hypothetical protein